MKKLYILGLFLASHLFYAQTEVDGLMMEKNNFCTGAMYEYSSWKNYWEGTFKRENLNLGTVSTQKIGLMGNYGISRKLNLLFNIPYVKTNASAGTLLGQKGVQDFSFTTKYMPYEKTFGENTFSAYIIGGFSFPTTNYVADYLPLSIGLHSKTLSLRLMGDLQMNNLFATISGAYVKRYTIEIDRDTYYSDRMHYTNKVDMPDGITMNARMGYRTNRLIAEAVFDTWQTLGKTFDISVNNMPFPSNTMNMTKIGCNGKYNLKKVAGLSLIGGFNHVTSGRNVGQSNTFYGGLFYIIDFNPTPKTKENEKK